MHFVRIEQRLARFAFDDRLIKKAALAQSIMDGPGIAAASKSTSDERGRRAEKRFALNAWEDEGGAVRPMDCGTIESAVKLACPS